MYKTLYETNSEFRRFVDKSSASYGYTVDELLKHETIREVAEYYAKKGADKAVNTTLAAGCGGAK